MRVTSALVAVAMAACSSDAPPGAATPDAAASDAADAAPGIDADPGASGASACDGLELRVLRVGGWPGGGLQLVLSMRDAEGAPRVIDQDTRPRLERSGGDRVHLAFQPSVERTGLTAIVVVPSADASEHAARLEAARAFASALPDGERIGVWVGGGELVLAADIHDARAHVLERIDAIASREPGAPADTALDALASRLGAVDSMWGPTARSLVVVGASAGTRQRGAPRDTVVALRASLSVSPGSVGAGLQAAEDAARWGGATTPTKAASLLAEHIAAVREHTAFAGSCDELQGGDLLTLVAGEDRCTFPVPEPPPHLSRSACNALQVARDAFPFPDVIELQMTAEQLEIHDERAADKSEGDFELSVVLGEGTPIAATGHFRGQTSLDCDRKNYNINLQGGLARRLMPGVASDELHLVSMCNERYYFRHVLATRMMRALGIFPLGQRYVRLRVAGRERGVYLLQEKPDEALIADHAELGVVIRRRFDAGGKKPELKYPDSDDAKEAAEVALDQYRALTAPIDYVAPDALYDALSQRLDFDGYLRWLAVNTYLQCGDYVDETFFYGSQETSASGTAYYFRNIGWDADDLFRKCHHDGKFAYDDPFGIVHCAEGDLDRALFASPDVYARFVATLKQLIGETFPPEVVSAELDEVKRELFSVLDDEPTCSGLQELNAANPDVTDCAGARGAVRSATFSFERRLRDQAALLEERIAAWELVR